MAPHNVKDGNSPSDLPLADAFKHLHMSSVNDLPKSSGMKNSTMSNGKSAPAEVESLDPSEVGMQCGFKNLYSGKEDRKGRFQWQDTIPEDVGEPVENAETSKWALLVRNVKVYNDPRKVLQVHSIVIQSPLLKDLLRKVLKDYPGVTAGLKRLEFSDPFEPLIHRWAELKAAIEKLKSQSQDDEKVKLTLEHAEVLYSLLKSEFNDMIDTFQDMKSKGVMTYDCLYTLFQPGAIIYSRQDGQETALKLAETKYGTDTNTGPCFWITGKYLDWDGTRFGTNKLRIKISAYSGTRYIAQLPAFPIEFHHDEEGLRKRLLERGANFEAFAGSHYKAYHGIGWKRGSLSAKDKYNIKGRIVIDTFGWNRFNPNMGIYVTPLAQKDGKPSLDDSDDDDDDDSSGVQDYSDDEYRGYNSYRYIEEVDEDSMPADGSFGDEDEEGIKRLPLTAEQKLVSTPLLRGYSLKTKQWLNFFVNSVKEIEWSTNAFDSLVLPANQKELILGFTESQRKYKASFDDIIEGKGKGIILLLCGPPGVGKTLTAESVAEEMRVPLYMMSAGDLGLDPRSVESKLQCILEMCTKWNAILLLDEADVFLEQRSLHELERNKLVSIFLRILEYYEGIMFLTTNRVNTFDSAFQSRIHISLEYPELSTDSRRTVWTNFLAASPQEHEITSAQLDALALMTMNGRQIKNVLKTAQLLASRRGKPLRHEHIITVLDVTQHLHNETRENERTRASLFC